MKISWKKWIPLFVFMIIICCGLTAEAKEEATVIKVGYTLNYGTVKSPIVVGNEGYGYEYLNTIFEHMEGDYELEFVYCEWLEVDEMIQNGEIDLFGPITYTEASSEAYLFTEDDFGDNFVFLSALEGNESVTNGYGNINGSTIAVQKNNPNEYMLYEFLEKYDLEVEVAYFTENDYESVMANFEYDYCLCSSLQTFQSLVPVVSLGVVDFYYVANLENTELIEAIDEAMLEVYETKYMYQEKLYLEYYDYSLLSDSYITEEEYALLQEKEVYYVGIEDIYGPIGYKNEEGEFEGIVVDVMDMLAEKAGIQYEFIEVTEDTTSEELELLDFSFLSYDENGREDTYESEAFCEMPFVLLARQMGEEITNVGILTHYGITEVAQEGHIYGREIVEYESLVELQEAFNSGEIDSLIMTTSNMNLVRNDFDSMDYTVSNLDISLNLCLIFQENCSEEVADIFNKLISSLDSKEVEASVLKHSTPQSEEITFESIIREYPYMIPVIIFLVAAMTIISVCVVSRKRQLELNRLLNYDRLTGVHSVVRFENDVNKMLKQEDGKKYSIVTIDIDNFKYINDLFGYEVGNAVIRVVANTITKISPAARLVTRNSSDNFIVFLERDGKEHKFKFDTEDRNKLYEELVPLIGETYNLSFSIGIYDIADKELDINFMVDCANIARREGKRLANTTIIKYNNDMDSKRMMATNIIANMVNGLNEHEFVVYYQPKVTLNQGNVVGAEALVRWLRNGTLVPPNEFIPLFEKNGFIEKLDYYVLNTVCEFLVEHPDAPKVSVNLSGVTVAKSNVVEQILRIVDQHQVPYEKLEFEITETALVDGFRRVVSQVEELRTHGFTISMDDFGVGISSLGRLKNMPIDTLKIDREFIVDSFDNEKGIEILRNVINMAVGLQLETVAEGIETQEQEELLKELGCDIGQGYKYARPLPEETFLGWLNKKMEVR